MRPQSAACSNRLTFQELYEDQVGQHLAGFVVPADYRERLLAAVRTLEAPGQDADRERRAVEARLDRIKELYDWGDYTRERYVAERGALQARLRELTPAPAGAAGLDALAAALESIRVAWDVSDQAERNRLARTLLEDARVLGDAIVGVKPRDEFAPFFRLNHEEWLKRKPADKTAGGRAEVTGSGSDGIRYRIRYTPRLGPGYQPCVVRSDRMRPPRRADAAVASERSVAAGGGSLRARARRLGVSHEAVRQAMRAAGVPTDLETRNARIRAMAERDIPWPEIAAAFGL
ncbi:MAG TPA: hypothetical protein VG370_15710, partial [Chloroflexota bacterium]|nr:hypothetical protein [Chloroflexota bacterium]